MIPIVREGNWAAKSVLKGKPVVLGNNVKVKWTGNLKDGDGGSLEASVILDTNSAANRLVGACKKKLESMVLDLAFVIEGQTTDELPEEILAAVRISKLSGESIGDG